MTRWNLVFTGGVQHVGFRFTAYRFAREQRLTGWVDNRTDGTVEMEVQGEQLELLQLLQKLSARFHIQRVERHSIAPVPGEKKFRVMGY